jgi:hypothetical protein
MRIMSEKVKSSTSALTRSFSRLNYDKHTKHSVFLLFDLESTAVKRLSGTHSKRFGPLKLYREELEHVLDLFHEFCKEVRLEDDEFTYDSLAEIKSRGQRIRHLEIRGNEPYVSLEVGTEKLGRFLYSDKNWLYSAEGDQAETLFFRLGELLSKHIRMLRYFFNWAVFVSFLMFNAAWFLFIIFIRGRGLSGLLTEAWI